MSSAALRPSELYPLRPFVLKHRTIQVALAVSLAFHLALLWQWSPRLRPPSPEAPVFGHTGGELVVRLAPPPAPPRPAVTVQPEPAPRREARVAAPRAPRRAASPPVLAMRKPAPAAVPKPEPPVVVPTPPETPATAPSPVPAPGGDLSSYIEAQRRARSEPAPQVAARAPAPPPAPAEEPVEDENARANRIAAANLGVGRTPTFGYDPSRSGGVFTIQRIGYDYAEFVFFGWNKDIRRNSAQLIEVRKGTNPDIRIAVVRRMIAIIREYEKEDFLWESHRLGRYVTLSARPRDNAGLEEFMMREFFGNTRAAGIPR